MRLPGGKFRGGGVKRRIMDLLLPVGGVGRLCVLLVLGFPGSGARAADDDFWAPPPIAQAVGAFEQGDLAGAESLVSPLAGDEEATAEACALLGQIRLKQRRVGEAVEQFERAVGKNPASPVLRSQLGAALLDAAGEAVGEARATLLQRARVELERAAGVDAGCVDAQMGLLRFHLLVPEAGPADAAERHAAQAAELDPLSANYDIGELAEQHGRHDLAEKYYGAAAKLFPTIPWLAFKHGLALLKLGRMAEARNALEVLLQAFPDFAPAQQILTQWPAQS